MKKKARIIAETGIRGKTHYVDEIVEVDIDTLYALKSNNKAVEHIEPEPEGEPEGDDKDLPEGDEKDSPEGVEENVTDVHDGG
ncbi:MAG: hypothetical protein ABSG75_11170 [Syntrophales bacterium]|jgi:hypothetical protein